MQAYELVYDVMNEGYKYWHIPLLGLVIAASAILYPRSWTGLPPASFWARHGRWVVAGLVAAFTGAGFAGTYLDYLTVRTALLHGKYRTVEGVVEDFKPMPADGRGRERFRVGDARFEYSENRATPGFNVTAREGGPIRSGLRVRIADVNGRIARLEIAR